MLLIAVDFQHNTIDGKRQFVAFHVPIVDELKDFVNGLAKGHEVGDVEAPSLGSLQALVVRLVAVFEAVHHHVIAVVVEFAAGHFLAVLQFKRSRSGIAWVGKKVVSSLGTGFVESVETLERHHDFAAHLEEVGEIAVQLEWHGVNGLYVGGHVIALGAVATGDGADEHTLFILQADAESVEF